LALAAQLLAQIPQTGGVNYRNFFVVYLLATQEQQVVVEFVEMVRQYAVDIGGDMLTVQKTIEQTMPEGSLLMGTIAQEYKAWWKRAGLPPERGVTALAPVAPAMSDESVSSQTT